MIEATDAGKVFYKTEHNAVGRFPEPGDEDRLAGPARNCAFSAADTDRDPRPHRKPKRR